MTPNLEKVTCRACTIEEASLDSHYRSGVGSSGYSYSNDTSCGKR